jgi:hypothetical protein
MPFKAAVFFDKHLIKPVPTHQKTQSINSKTCVRQHFVYDDHMQNIPFKGNSPKVLIYICVLETRARIFKFLRTLGIDFFVTNQFHCGIDSWRLKFHAKG